MNSFKQQIFAFIGITGIYVGVLTLVYPEQLIPTNWLSIGLALVIFFLSTLVTSTGKPDPEANARKFLLGTTIQMLMALFFVLLVRYTAGPYFKAMVIHFIVLFFAFLIVQSIFLVRKVRS